VSISEISIAEFMPIHDQGVYLVDVREIDEYESGHVTCDKYSVKRIFESSI